MCVYEKLSVTLSNKINFFDEYSDMSWLTQVPSIENNDEECDSNQISYVEDELVGNIDGNIVSLEEEGDMKGMQVLYDNVVCEPISSDKEVDNM